jgi:opacity protein-like surface antigen
MYELFFYLKNVIALKKTLFLSYSFLFKSTLFMKLNAFSGIRITILTTVLLFVITQQFGQTWKFLRHEVTGGIGSTSFLGELGGANRIGSTGIMGFRDVEFKATRPAITAGYRYFIQPNMAVKGGITFGLLSGNDAYTQERFRQNRNLHFRSPVVEIGGQFEYYPFGEYFGHLYRTKGVAGQKVSVISPYLFAGIGGFWFNPKAKYEDDWIALQPLMTENVSYRRIAISIPFGVGVKYALNKQMSISAEFTLRYTTTDYIDDVSTVYADKSDADAMSQYLANPTLNLIPSYTDGTYSYNATGVGMQRGQPKQNDSFAILMFSFNYKILQGRKNLPKF